jgi:hypothetical protein
VSSDNILMWMCEVQRCIKDTLYDFHVIHGEMVEKNSGRGKEILQEGWTRVQFKLAKMK